MSADNDSTGSVDEESVRRIVRDELSNQESGNEANGGRREFLQALGLGGLALGAGSGAGYAATESIGSASAQASSSDSDGDIGTSSNPVDVFADGISASSIDTERATVTDASDITVSVPSDYATVQDAVDALSKKVIPQTATATINIESGHQLQPVQFYNGRYNHIIIDSEDAEVPVDTNVVDAGTWIIDIKRSYGPKLATLIDAKGLGGRGLSAGVGSVLPKLAPGAGVKNVDGIGCRPGGASNLHIQEGVFTGCNTGIDTVKSWVRASYVDVSGCGTGIQCDSSSIRADGADASNCDSGMTITSGSTANVSGADVSGATNTGLAVSSASAVVAGNLTATDCGAGSVNVAHSRLHGSNINVSNGHTGNGVTCTGGYMTVPGIDASDNPNRALGISEGSVVNAKNAVLTGSDQAIRCDASYLYAEGVDASNSTSTAVDLRIGTDACLFDLTINGSSSDGLSVAGNSTAEARFSTIQASGTDVSISDGSFVTLDSTDTSSGSPAVGDTNVSAFNDLTKAGAIFA